ncbi:MAG: hypothetical protein ACTSPW_01885 [Promethearchaeota archaeon]
MVSIITLASIAPLFIIIIAILFSIINSERILRKFLIIFLLTLALIINSLLSILFFLSNIVEREYYLNLEFGTIFTIEIILAFGILVFLFSKDEISNIENENILDCLILVIISCLIGSVLTSNIIIIFGSIILIFYLIGGIFYFGEYKKEFEILKPYFFGVGISTTLLLLAVYLIFIGIDSVILTTLKVTEVSTNLSILISFLILFGLGIPCGLFPFSVYHLKRYFQDSSYSNIIIFTSFSFIITLTLVRILNAFSLLDSLFGFILMLISIIGLIISLSYILTEIFSSLDGNTYSIKKVTGYSICADFNIFLLLISFVSCLSRDLFRIYLNSIIFFCFIIISIKALIIYTFYPVMLETEDDNIKLLGNFINKYKGFGISLIVSGLIISFPISYLTLNSLLNLFLNKALDNSLLHAINAIIFFLLILYLGILLIVIAVLYVQIYFGNEPRYAERESVKPIKRRHYIPLIVLFIIIIFLVIQYILNNGIFYNIYHIFFLIIES